MFREVALTKLSQILGATQGIETLQKYFVGIASGMLLGRVILR
jgi:hypothetical protein